MNEVAPLFRALADMRRLAIAALVADRALPLARIAETVDLAPATVAHHLRVLQRAGLLDVTKGRGATAFRFRSQPLLATLGRVGSRPPQPAFTEGMPSDEQKILRAFIKEGKLTMLPVQPAKREVVLRFLAGQFEAGRTYAEKEVNAILTAYHGDYATLRRALVDARLMERDKGVYWRASEGNV